MSPTQAERGWPMARMLDLARSWPWLAGFFMLTVLAFWPTYLSVAGAASGYIHFHAATAAGWMLLLIGQAWAIGARKVPLHRALGKASYALASLLLISVVLLAHDKIVHPPAGYAPQTYVLYLQLSLALLFGLSYGLAIWHRRSVARHSRFMVCTALTLVDPVVIRILFWINPAPDFNDQWLTFGLTDLVFLILIWLERGNRAGRGVFPAMLAVFVALQLPALLGLTEGALWQGFARWFASL
jgi:hypothetical protein